MESTRLNWGFLSTAHINNALVKPLRISKRNRLLGVASRDLDKAQAAAARWNIPKAYGSYEAMLSDPEIDVIYNSLPNSLHAEWTIKAAQAGKHILCEKPLALTVEDVDAMASAARQAGVVLAEAFMYLHHPQTVQVKTWVDEGLIGDVQIMRGAFSYVQNRPNDVRLDPDLGGGSLWDVGCYPISYARYILGAEPEEVFGWQVIGSTGVDTTFSGQLRFLGGALAQFDCSFCSSERHTIEVIGNKAELQVPDPYKPGYYEHLILSHDDKVKRLGVKGQALYLGEVEDIASAILDGKAPRISLEFSRGNIAVINALIKSAQEDRPIKLLEVNQAK